MVRLGRIVLVISLILCAVTCGDKSTGNRVEGVQGETPASLAGVWETQRSFRACNPMAVPTLQAWIDTFCVGTPEIVDSNFFGRPIECEGEISETGALIVCESAIDFGYRCVERMRLDIVGAFFEDSISLTYVMQFEIDAVDEATCPAGLNGGCYRIVQTYRRLGPMPESCGESAELWGASSEAVIRELIGRSLDDGLARHREIAGGARHGDN